MITDPSTHGVFETGVKALCELVHSHGGRVQLMQSGELIPDVAFLAVASCDTFGNASGSLGKNICGSLGYAKAVAQFARQVVLITEAIEPYPHNPASIHQDQVDFIVKVDEVGDSSKIGAGSTRMTTNPRELLIARRAADVIDKSGYFNNGFSLQTGSGGASLAVNANLPVLPIANNAGEFWPKQGWGKKAGTIQVVVGPLMYANGTGPRAIAELNEYFGIQAE